MGTSARPQGGGKHATVTKYRTVSVPGHPLAQADGKAYKHRVVLYEKIGDGNHDCHWCAKKIGWFAERDEKIVSDHLDGDKWNNSPENIVASCWSCNLFRGYEAITHCKNGHEFTKENTYTRPDNGQRQCVTCKKSTWQRYYEKHRKKKV